MITLNKKNTYSLLYQENKFESLKKRIRFRTMHKWWCLNCGSVIYVDYNVTTAVHIFCDDVDCKISVKQSPSIIMQQYLLRLKQEQSKVIDLLNADNDIIQ